MNDMAMVNSNASYSSCICGSVKVQKHVASNV